jgi:hydroxymethylbilane synthase
MTALRIGTRGSALALWQANYVAGRLRPLAAPRPVELVEIQTAGDQDRGRPLSQLGSIGVFTKEIQQALLAGTVDVAVHSLKDLPTIPVEGLVLAAVPPRGPAGDVFVSRRYHSFDALPGGARVATSSLRRRAQILYRRSHLQVVDVRGNVPTRLRKLEEENLDALILAQAGLERLGLAAAITERLHPGWMLPAVGQGALGLESRREDEATRALLHQIDDPPTHRAVQAERSMLRSLGGGCLVPIGAATEIVGDTLHLRGAVFSPDGKQCVEGSDYGPLAQAEVVGERLARLLQARGANDLLKQR